MNELINNFINSYPKKDNYSKEDVTKIMQAFSANVQNSVKNNIDFQMKDLMISKDLFQFIKDQIYFFKEISANFFIFEYSDLSSSLMKIVDG